MINGSLINEPCPNLVKFYYYYSYFTLIISWTLAPLLFYAILTQSKTLGKFKWLIFNYSFWSLCLTTLLSLIKPIIFMPAAAGIQIGIFRDLMDYKSTMIFSIFSLVTSGTCFTGLCATLAYRYLFVFPSTLKNWVTLKKATMFTLLFPIFVYSLLIPIYLPTINISKTEIHEDAKRFDLFLEKYFVEQTFFCVSYQLIHISAKISLFFVIIAFILGIFIIAFLNYQMKKYYKTKKISKTLKSLILSSIIQIFTSLTFFMSPCLVFFGCINFQIPYTSSLFVIIICLMVSHCFIDFLVTLYFLVPYRKFVLTLFRVKFAQPIVNVVSIQQQTVNN